ncbi:helix-turn-helix domain-containing protein [Dysosmobacter sp. Phy]
MTIGQRVGQKRKELGLSQEALGEQLGVSRQSIYKWESDSALPEIDKLIALSRLFGVSVGWLLGVEEPPQDDGADAEPAPETGELTEAQLRMVEEIVARYTAALPQPPSRRRRKWLKAAVIAAALCLVGGLYSLSKQLDRMDQQYGTLQNNITRVESTVNSQIGSISSRVEEILKAQNSLTADYGCEQTALDPAANTVSFRAWAVPKTYVEGMTAVFQTDSGSGPVEVPAVLEPGQTFSAGLTAELTDSITVSVVFIAPDGTRSTQLLDQFYSLYSDTMPTVDIQSNFMWMDLTDGALVLTENSHERYLWTREQIWSDSAAAIADVRVGLFKNRQLAAWAEPCEQPDSFHGFEDCSFYCLPELRLDLTAQDTVEIAAVVTDVYGRTIICQDVPYVPDLEDGDLVHPDISSSDSNPANWHY